MEFIVIIVWLALCGAAAAYASSKGRSGVGIFFLSLFLSPLVGFVVALVMSTDEKKVAVAQGKKKCPQCAEFVQPDAKICRFCQHIFEEEKPVELTEVEQLAASGIPAGPPCPKCSSVSTYSVMESVKASRWWKQSCAPFLLCRKCGDKWQPEDSAPIESLGMGLRVGLVFVVFAIFSAAFVVYATHAVRMESAKGTASSTPVTDVPAASGTTAPHSAESNWRTSDSVSSIDGVKTTVLTNGYGTRGIVIRFRGKRLDAYVNTPEMIGHNDTSVRIRFDEGKPIRQTWSRSDDYHALFSPDPRGLLAKLQTSKTFYIEYHPYEKVPDTLTFNVAGLVVPKALLDAHDKLRQQERAAWQKKYDACMEERRHSSTASYETEDARRSFCKIMAQ